MRVVAALISSLPVLGSAAPDWGTWDNCPSTRRLQEEPALEPAQSDVRAANSETPLPDFRQYEDRHQIIKINADTGKLEINANSAVWTELGSLNEEVKLIVTFGKPGTGKSTLASMLGCEMAKEQALLFPIFAGNEAIPDKTYTEGVWATKPFPYSTWDEQGRETITQYMILDMQSLGRAETFQNKLSAAMTQDALLKILALMSEVSSVFVYTVESEALTLSDWSTIGLAFQTTRENMVLRSAYEAEGSSAVDKALDLKSHNDPAMILVTKFKQNKPDLVVSNSFESNTQYIEEKAKESWDVLCAPTADGTCSNDPTNHFGTLMQQNFVDIQHGDNQFPFIYNPVPSIGENTKDSGNFNWGNVGAYKYQAGEHCRIYEAMYSERWNCSETTPARASDPSVYKLMIRNMVDTIVNKAPVRLVSWKDQRDPVRLTGERMQNVLTVGIEEMNSIGPLPQSELWRKIMQDRCRGELKEWLDFTYGEREGLYQEQHAIGKLKQISNGLADMWSNPSATIDEMVARWGVLSKVWTEAESMEVSMKTWFGDKVLMQSVQATCRSAGLPRAELINQTYATYVQEFNVLEETLRRQKVEEDLRRSQSDLRDVLAWARFDQYKLYILAFSLIGLVALGLMMRMFRQVNQSCRVCASCCGDIGDTATTTKIVRKDGGVAVSHKASPGKAPSSIPQASAVAVVTEVGGTSSGSSSSSKGNTAARMQGLAEKISALQQRVPTRDLAAQV